MKESHPTIIEMLDEIEEIILDGSQIPFRSGKLVNDQEILDTLDLIRDQIPQQLKESHEIIKRGQNYILECRTFAEEIVRKATARRNEILCHPEIRKEAENRFAKSADKMPTESPNHTHRVSLKSNHEELLLKGRITNLERQYKAKKLELNKQFLIEFQSLDKQLSKKKEKLERLHHSCIQSNKQNIKTANVQINRIKLLTKIEAGEIRKKAIEFKKNIILECKQLVLRSTKKGAYLRADTRRYVDQTLAELNNQLYNINIIINSQNKTNTQRISLGKFPQKQVHIR